MAARDGVVDTSVFKGIADLHAGVMAEDHVVAPAHEVVQDSDLIADPSAPTHADAAPEHSGDTAATSSEDASAGDAGHVHADLAYADADHGYADVDHAYADHAYADVDHAYADHAYADAAVPDSTVAFADHSMLQADEGTPHSLGADAGKGDDDHNAAAWWWAGGAALAAGGIGYWLGTEHNDDNTETSASPDVHVVVERDGAWIDTNGNGVHESAEDTAAVFQGGNAGLGSHAVTIHFNDVPLDALNLTGFGTDDKIEFHVEAMMGHNILNTSMGHLTYLSVNSEWPDAAYYFSITSTGVSSASGNQIRIHQHDGSSLTDFGGNVHDALGGYMWIDNIATSIQSSTDGGFSTTSAVIAFWNDAGNALNDNAHLLPNFTGTNGSNNANTVLGNLNANNEGGVVDFIWPAGAPIVG